MDILSVISEQTTSVALALTIMWFYNKLVQDMLLERKEWRETVQAERREWQQKSDTYIEQLFELNRLMTEALTANRMELSNLKGKLADLLASLSGKRTSNDKSERES